MVPAASWSPDDYYQASRRARRAWQTTQPQQVLPGVLEEVDAGTTPLVASTSSSASPARILPSGGRARKERP